MRDSKEPDEAIQSRLEAALDGLERRGKELVRTLKEGPMSKRAGAAAFSGAAMSAAALVAIAGLFYLSVSSQNKISELEQRLEALCAQSEAMCQPLTAELSTIVPESTEPSELDQAVMPKSAISDDVPDVVERGRVCRVPDGPLIDLELLPTGLWRAFPSSSEEPSEEVLAIAGVSKLLSAGEISNQVFEQYAAMIRDHGLKDGAIGCTYQVALSFPQSVENQLKTQRIQIVDQYFLRGLKEEQ